MYTKGNFLAVDQNRSNLYKIFYNRKPIYFDKDGNHKLFSIKEVLSMGFTELVK